MEAITTALTEWGTSMTSDVTSMVTTMLPIALGIVGLFFAVKKGIQFFKSTAGK